MKWVCPSLICLNYFIYTYIHNHTHAKLYCPMFQFWNNCTSILIICIIISCLKWQKPSSKVFGYNTVLLPIVTIFCTTSLGMISYSINVCALNYFKDPSLYNCHFIFSFYISNSGTVSIKQCLFFSNLSHLS